MMMKKPLPVMGKGFSILSEYILFFRNAIPLHKSISIKDFPDKGVFQSQGRKGKPGTGVNGRNFM